MKYDLVINNGSIIDGVSDNRYFGNIGINKDKIATIIKNPIKGNTEIDANGLIVAPGFIDVHTHLEPTYIRGIALESKITQGVTTNIVGNCGISIFPHPKDLSKEDDFNSYLSELLIGVDNVKESFKDGVEFANSLKNKGISTNCGYLIGHGTLRISAMGFEDRGPKPNELEIMKELLEHEMKNGALGMSLGLIYPPGSYSILEEIVELSKIVKKYNGIVVSHMRNEGDKVFQSVDEMIKIAEQSGVHVHISHLKIMGLKNRGRANELIDKIQEAIVSGILITVDQYPYNATSTTLSAVVPNRIKDEGNLSMLKKLSEFNKELLKEIRDLIEGRGGPETISISFTNYLMPEIEGKNLLELSEVFKENPELIVAKILIKCEGKVNAIYQSMSDEDVFKIMSCEDYLIASDGFAFEFIDSETGAKPHPRSFGTFPKFLSETRDRQLMSMEKAIKKISYLPAKYYNLNDIGSLEIGKNADITIFDSDRIKDNSTFDDPFQKSEGIEYVINNGEIILEHGNINNLKSGIMLKIK